MSASARFLEVLQRLESSVFRWIGTNGPSPVLVPAWNEAVSPRAQPDSLSDKSRQSVLDDIFDSCLLAVPKFRRSLERRMTRRMGGKRHFDTYGRPKTNIVACLECGHWHEKHTICGHCYSKVREETKLLQEAMGEEANIYAPQTETTFVYEGEDSGNRQDKFVVHIKKKRPEWFSRTLTSTPPVSNTS